MILASLSMLNNKKPHFDSDKQKCNYLWIAGEGLIVGGVTGFVGAGGVFIIVPALVVLIGLPMKVAVGTSMMIIAVKSLFGFLGICELRRFNGYFFLFSPAWLFLGSYLE